MVRGIAHGHVCTTTMTVVELRKMAAILEKIDGRDMQPWFTMYFFDI